MRRQVPAVHRLNDRKRLIFARRFGFRADHNAKSPQSEHRQAIMHHF